MFEILRNSPNNCLVGRIFVLIMNICLWLVIPCFILEICISDPLSLKKAIIVSFSFVALVADYFFIHSVVPDLSNPFKKKNILKQEEAKEQKTIVATKTMDFTLDAEESLKKAAKSGDGIPDMSAW